VVHGRGGPSDRPGMPGVGNSYKFKTPRNELESAGCGATARNPLTIRAMRPIDELFPGVSSPWHVNRLLRRGD